MGRQFLIIPEMEKIGESVELSEKYHTAFEYNDFFNPPVYENPEEIEKRFGIYKALNRDRSRDTLHGVFFDVAPISQDSYIRKYSQKLIWQCMKIGEALGVRGVVFHTGLIAGLEIPSYLKGWLEGTSEFFRTVATEYSGMDIYMENTMERSPDMLLALKENLRDLSNFKLCFDYGHAALTDLPIEEWARKMSGYTGHIHLNDNDLKKDLHQVPGEGSIDFQQCKTLLDRYETDVPVLLELNGIENQAKALKYVKKIQL